MKKMIALLLACMLVFAVGCSNVQETASNNSAIEEEAAVEQIVKQAEDQPGSPMEKSDLASELEVYVENGVLTEADFTAFMAYLEANDPANGGLAGVDPLQGAVEEGILTVEQAAAMDLSDILREPGMDAGQASGPETSTEAMLSLEEANAMEAELLAAVGYTSEPGGYPIVDTNERDFYNNDSEIEAPAVGEAFYGQDASYQGNQPSYRDNGDGTISDLVTGLMWQQDPGEKINWQEAVEKLDDFELAGYDDWRLPTIKELYSLVDFSGVTGMSSDESIPYMDTDYFEFEYGDAAGEHRFIDSQMVSSTIYDSRTLGDATTVFGYNFADGRIKGYPITKNFYVYYVRGNSSYGQNLFVDNNDETITDEATELMWMTYDSGYYGVGDIADGTMDWEDALAWAETFELAGYDDWRLPNVKELQSLVDYTKSPDTTDSPAIDDLFDCTSIINAFGEADYGFYWTGTTHVDGETEDAQSMSPAAYVVFGKGMGVFNSEVVDAHGAGSQRSDPKMGKREDYPSANLQAPQGDEQRVFNMVRLVRNAE